MKLSYDKIKSIIYGDVNQFENFYGKNFILEDIIIF